jgi:glycosyltransferase involved in cell wall biosynthesis
MSEEQLMITIVIPTRNRAYTLEKVADSYYTQMHVNEIIIVDDCGQDNTSVFVESLQAKYPHIHTKYIKHAERRGAAACRTTGYTRASNEYILFGEDDAYIEENYTVTLLKRIASNSRLGLVSGRIIYLQQNETPQEAILRFGDGIENKTYLNLINLSINRDARQKGDFLVPFTHALFMTKKSLLELFQYDQFYSKGNGFREETDYQLNLFTNSYQLLVTNDTHCFHFHLRDVVSGGQRISRLSRFYWAVIYTNYMYDKYFDKLRENLGIAYSKKIAKILFAVSQFYILFIRPIRKFLKSNYQRLIK